jgi:hypothetical protein
MAIDLTVGSGFTSYGTSRVGHLSSRFYRTQYCKEVADEYRVSGAIVVPVSDSDVPCNTESEYLQAGF